MKFLSLALTLLPTFALSVPLEIKRAGTSLPAPSQDPFYKVPADIASYSAGQVVQKRDVETNIEGKNVASSYQVSYRSLTTKQNPDLTVATVWTPTKPADPVRIFSYQTYEDSTNLDCAPSWAFTKPTDSKNTFVTSLDTPIYINYALSKGWYVVAADHEGSQAAFISGRQQGQAVLDGVRALINQEKLPADSQVGLLGYSGGASATVWAENLYAQGYASELNIVGGAHGGTPIDTLNLFNFLNKSFFAGFAGAGVVGLTNAYPELDQFIQQYATPKGKVALGKYRDSGYCIVQVATGNPFTDFLSYIDYQDPFSAPVPKKVLSEETLLIANASTPSQVATPKFPRFIFHALEDGIVPYADAKKYVKQQCEAGSDIAFSTLPVAEHLLGEVLGLVPAISFITKAFEGKAPKVVCGTSLPAINPRSQQAKEILGSDLQAQLLSLNGKTDFLGDVLRF